MTTPAQRVFATPNAYPRILGGIVAALRTGVHAAATHARARRARPWIGSVASPLAFVAAMLGEQWMLVPFIVLCMWWWAPRNVGCEWVVALQAGGVGVEWALIGGTCFAHFPDHTLLVGVLWAGAAAGIAGLCGYNRRHAVIGY